MLTNLVFYILFVWLPLLEKSTEKKEVQYIFFLIINLVFDFACFDC